MKIVDPRILQAAELKNDGLSTLTVREDKRLMLAVELSVEGNAQHSGRLELLNLVRALEVLADPMPVGAAVRSIIKDWRSDIDALVAEEVANPVGVSAEDLKRLKERLSFFYNESIFKSLVKLTEDSYSPTSLESQQWTRINLQAAVREAYDVRSELVHKGRCTEQAWKERSRPDQRLFAYLEALNGLRIAP
jgi:hypothetical protein